MELSPSNKILILSDNAVLCEKIAQALTIDEELGITDSISAFLSLLHDANIHVVVVDAAFSRKVMPGILPLLAHDHPSIGRILMSPNERDPLSPLAHYGLLTHAPDTEIRQTVCKALDWHLLFQQHLQLTRSLNTPPAKGENGSQAHDASEALRRSNIELRRLATTDPLTGIGNRRLLSQQLHLELNRAKRYERPLSILFIDIDFFKQFNDQFGHDIGDQVLKELASALVDNVRRIDIVTRYGGEEFVIILPETPKRYALLLANRIRRKISKHPFSHRLDIPVGSITISVGISTYPADGATATSLISHADRALFSAKRRGRNLVLGAPLSL